MARTAASDARFVTVRSEGGLLPPDLLARIAASDPDLGGWKPEDYGLARGERLNEAMARAWTNVRAFWAAFRATSGSLRPSESGVSETREQWLLPLFRELGYGRLTFRGAAEEIDGKRYAISHQAGEEQGGEAPPIHTLSFRQDIEKSTAAGMGGGGTGALGGLRTSPHGMVQDYLNRSDDHLWGVVTNGLRLRLLRDNASLSRAAFVEFDLEAMLEGGVYADFVLLYLLLHRSRLPGPGRAGAGCWLERWRLDAAARGTRALEALREGVEAAIRALGQGLLEHPANEALREQLRGGQLTVADYYRQLLRLVYRLLFLLAAEERDLLFPEGADARLREVYARHYGVGRLRALLERRRGADRHDDLWRSLRVAFAALRGERSAALGLLPLGGGLFGASSCPDLDGALVGNERLLEAVRGLTYNPKTSARVNYRDMNVEELGSVYEGLLDRQPSLQTTGARPEFKLVESGERKSTGSFYTNDGLVRELIASALEPVIAAALERGRTTQDKRANLLALKVCDPACGSGHFLLAAARRVGREIARLDAGETEPDPAEVRHATREAIQACVYGVDRNPLAVDLCKLALWIEAQEGGRPLGFLDHHIKHGNSLVGATRALMNDGIPDEVFEPVTGDDKKYASAVKRRNRQERAGQLPQQYALVVIEDDATLRDYFAEIKAPEETAEDVAAKEAAYQSRRRARAFRRKRLVADLWTATAFWPLRPGAPEPPTHGVWRRLAGDPKLTDYLVADKSIAHKGTSEYRTAHQARRFANEYAFFHWELEFEEVFGGADPGFDCILGNPPWEELQPEELKFFAERAPEIAVEAGATRKALITRLEKHDPALAREWQKHVLNIELESKFTRVGGRFPLTSFGKVNLYSSFAELFTQFVRLSGQVGILVPTGIATDDSNRRFFSWLVNSGRLVALFDFENREGVFPNVHRSYKFSLLTVAGNERQAAPFEVAFFLTQPDQLRDASRRFTLSSIEIALFNPNSRTCPIFRSRRDAEITRGLYSTAPVLVREGDPQGNAWKVALRQGLFNMTSDSNLFRTWNDLIAQDSSLGTGGRFRNENTTYLPLYEAKLIHQFDHRFATYEHGAKGETTRDLTEAEHANPTCPALPRYWVNEHEVEREVGSIRREHPGWFIGFRDIARNTDERTAIFSLVPWAAVGHTLPLCLPECSAPQAAAFLANCNSIAFDYACRQKVGGTHLTFFIVKQLPVLPPLTYTSDLIDLITPRVLELVYTAHDLAPFARDCGYDGPPFVWDEERRVRLRADLDGIYALLYGLGRDDFAYILDTFPIVARKDEARWGEYRTRRLCLEAYDRFKDVVGQLNGREVGGR